MSNEIQFDWQALKETRLTKRENPTPFNPAATPDMIEQRLARVLGVLIPQQLQESLLMHDGITDRRGEFFQGLGPGSIEWIIRAWRDDRKREAEAADEGDQWIKPPTLIPVFHDATAHCEIYIDSLDGTMKYYDPAGHAFWDYVYPSYSAMLRDILWHMQNDCQWEWGVRMTRPV